MTPAHVYVFMTRISIDGEINSQNSERLTFVVNLESIIRTTVVSCKEKINKIATAKQELWDLCTIIRSQKWRQ